MTPDKVVKNLELFINKLDNPSPGGTTLQIPKQALQSAITLLQDYQKLRERVKELESKVQSLYDDQAGASL